MGWISIFLIWILVAVILVGQTMFHLRYNELRDQVRSTKAQRLQQDQVQQQEWASRLDESNANWSWIIDALMKHKQEIGETKWPIQHPTMDIMNKTWQLPNSSLPQGYYPHFNSRVSLGPTYSIEDLSGLPSRLCTAVIYINLTGYTEREKALLQSLHEYWPEVPVIRLEGIVDTQYKDLGILKSHLSALQLAEGFSGPVCIMEDDFRLCSRPEDMVDQLPHSYDVWHLAPKIFMWSALPSHPSCLRIRQATLGSAYIVSETYRQTLIKHLENTLHHIKVREWDQRDSLDQTWNALMRRDYWITTKQMMGNQAPGQTTGGDIADNSVSYDALFRMGRQGDSTWPLLEIRNG